ncbi:PBECR4 domain-containing protein [Lactococcus lactis]|uniref:PBECR4 domain-containing protein n=1 Tax=Lactococcus lactis TaxID=1358 RepID=A0AB35KD73_9LACT|nr:PBECR4 domain-containing protein [Lactococcus lactis]MDG4979798.1 PBECR4 domain-containing protein [Lactococcus lactis]MDG5049673.1 PBECR4 domain-containing protein [Lactococcus lactis]
MEKIIGFKKPTNSEFLILQKELLTIKSVLSFIDSELIGKDIIICTQKTEISFKMETRNIPHLLGIYYDRGGKALWKDFKRNRLSIRNILKKLMELLSKNYPLFIVLKIYLLNHVF